MKFPKLQGRWCRSASLRISEHQREEYTERSVQSLNMSITGIIAGSYQVSTSGNLTYHQLYLMVISPFCNSEDVGVVGVDAIWVICHIFWIEGTHSS